MSTRVCRNDELILRTEIDQKLKFLVKRLHSPVPKSDGDESSEELKRLREVIEFVSRMTSGFCPAMNRLRRAERFLISGEIGSACYELNLLLDGV